MAKNKDKSKGIKSTAPPARDPSGSFEKKGEATVAETSTAASVSVSADETFTKDQVTGFIREQAEQHAKHMQEVQEEFKAQLGALRDELEMKAVLPAARVQQEFVAKPVAASGNVRVNPIATHSRLRVGPRWLNVTVGQACYVPAELEGYLREVRVIS